MARKKLTVRQLKLNLYEPEDIIVQKIEEKGLEVGSEIRQMIRDYGEKHFQEDPAYAKALQMRAELKKKELEAKEEFEKMTPEDYVVNVLRGKVRDGRAVFRIANGKEMLLSMDNIKSTTKENNEIVAVHNELLDRTFRYPGEIRFPGDREPDWDKIWAGWEDEE